MGFRRTPPLQSIVLAIITLIIGCGSGFAMQYGFAPVSGQMTSPFGWRVDPMTGSQRFHGGVDIGAASGTPVYAPQGGYVMFSGSYGGYGNVVVLNHGSSLYTLYGHNSRLLVNNGDLIQKGQMISLVGSTGRSTGPHLHFEVHYNGQYINPVTYLAYLQPYTQASQVVAQTHPVMSPPQQRNQPAHRAAAQKKTVASAKLVQRKRYPNKAYGSKVVELVTGANIENVEFSAD